jgi:hypothetical protein
MKVAVAIQGMYRTFDRCWPRIAGWLQPYNPDIYVLSHEPETVPALSERFGTNRVISVPDDPQPECDYRTGLGQGVKSLQVDLRQLNDLRTISQAVREGGCAYDWIIRIRTDLWFITLPEALESLTPDAVYIPTHDNWRVSELPGMNDRFAFGPPALMHPMLERYDQLPEFWSSHHMFHMETFHAWALRGVPVKRTRATFGMMRTSGEYVPPYRIASRGDVPAVEVCKS